MKTLRVIPRIDIKGPNVVKGIHLEGLRVLGAPEAFSRYYYENGADEIIYMDVVASLYGRNSLLDMISKTAEHVFVPITVGGGLRSVSDISAVLMSGADKVCLNTAAIKTPSLISEAVDKFGSSTVIVAIEVIQQKGGEYLAFVDNGRERTGIEVKDWAKKVQDLGAGEILLTSIDREGTGKGFDIELINQIMGEVNIPIIAHGGAGNKEHITNVVKKTNCDAVSIASVLHYETMKQIPYEISSKREGNNSFLSSKRKVSNIETCKIEQIKEELSKFGIDVRR